MYDYLTNLIIKDLKKNIRFVSQKRVDEIYVSLIFILYLGHKKETKNKIKELLEQNNLELLNQYLITEYKFRLSFQNFDYLKILKIMKGQKYLELLDEFLKAKKDPEYQKIEILQKSNSKILYINTDDAFSNYNYTDKNITYLKESIDQKHKSTYNFYRLLDEMLKLKRTYFDYLNEVYLNNYDTIIINDTEPFYKYSSAKENFIKDIETKLYYKSYKGKIILKTSYNKISHFKYSYLIRYHLSKVILHAYVKNVTVYMEFLPNNNDSISLILLDDELSKDNTKLQKVIENNRNKKGTLIKVTPEAIIKNNYRISFKMYDTENIEKVKIINDIVDENTELTRKLESLNNVIEIEVNKLLERKGG